MSNKTTQHTPGPWTFGQVGKGQVFDIIGPDLTGRGREIVGSFRADQNAATNNANARLIGAGPELLEALQALEPMFDNDSPLLTVYKVEIKQALAAIAKAEGK